VKLRPTVQAFAESMERKLRENNYKGGWRSEAHVYLLYRLCEEVAELVATIKTPPNEYGYSGRDEFMLAGHHLKIAASILQRCTAHTEGSEETVPEAADVANFAMMLADICRRATPSVEQARHIFEGLFGEKPSGPAETGDEKGGR